MHGSTAADRISWGDSDEESISDLENEAVRREVASYRESEEEHALIMQGALAAGRRMMAKEAFNSLEKMKVEDLPAESKGKSRNPPFLCAVCSLCLYVCLMLNVRVLWVEFLEDLVVVRPFDFTSLGVLSHRDLLAAQQRPGLLCLLFLILKRPVFWVVWLLSDSIIYSLLTLTRLHNLLQRFRSGKSRWSSGTSRSLAQV